jgi:outer membrane protein assembly factor BamD (BamD/ComL family)
LLANHREQDGLIAYLTVDLVHSSDPDSHAEALYRLQELWDQGRYPQRASEARRRLEADYPESAWAARLRRPVH